MTYVGIWIVANAVSSHQIVAQGLLREMGEMQEERRRNKGKARPPESNKTVQAKPRKKRRK